MHRIDESEIEKNMQAAEIQSVSIAFGASKESISVMALGDSQKQYGAASLSKPVFTYLVLKLISDGIINLDTQLNAETKSTEQENPILTFSQFCLKNGINFIDSEENNGRVNQFTPAMILSHQTGLPIGYNDSPDPKYEGKPAPLKFDFEPGEGYGYSGLHLMYLQQWIEEKTGKKLEELAQEYIFDKTKADMPNSTFISSKGQNAANSLHTTAEDYVRFCVYWMKDPDTIVQRAFTIQVMLIDDPWAVREKVSSDTLSHLAWGYGWGLETNDKGDVIVAFHTGDMNEWRSGVKLDLVAKQATVLFTKSTHENGHVLQEQVFGQSHALNYFFDKFKFARSPEELRNDWREKRSFGIRKGPAAPSQANEGPGAVQKHANSVSHMQVGKTVPPKPSQSTTALLHKSIASNASMNNISEWQINLVNQVIHALRNYYCLPDKFSAHENDFKKSLIEAFAQINKGHNNSSKLPSSKEEYQPYLDALNIAMQKFDPHLDIEYGKEFISDRKRLNQLSQSSNNNAARFDFGDGPPQSVLSEINEFRGRPTNNYGFINTPRDNVEIPDNIGYIKIDVLIDPQLGIKEKDKNLRVGPNAMAALDNAMKNLVGKEAIIIDLRDAPEGGSPEMVQSIVSYFIAQKGIVINEIDDRMTGTRTPYTVKEMPHQLYNVPVRILTDHTTFSAREELAYDFQQLNIQLQRDGLQMGDRFQIIGGVTKGGAHPECAFPLVDSQGQINSDLILRIPYACSINPTSKTNWEDQDNKGVQPDTVVDSRDALKVAISSVQLNDKLEVKPTEGKRTPTPFDMELKRK